MESAAADFWRIGTCLCIKTQSCLHTDCVNYFQSGCLKTPPLVGKTDSPVQDSQKEEWFEWAFCASLHIAYVVFSVYSAEIGMYFNIETCRWVSFQLQI